MSETEMREIDVHVAERVMGWKPIDRKRSGWGDGPTVWDTGDLLNPSRQDFRPTTNSADAMAVLKRCCANNGRNSIVIRQHSPNQWMIGTVNWSIEEPTLELAICQFALKLYGGKEL